MNISRRKFIAGAAAACGWCCVQTSFGGWAWSLAAMGNELPVMVVILLRGAVDGLSVVVPYQEAGYYSRRPTLALPGPGKDQGVLDLDGAFGLHPAMAPLLPWFKAGRLAFVQACGSPDPTRSHFDAQDYMETGTPGVKATKDGWLNRAMAVLGGAKGTFDGVAFSPTQPVIARGAQQLLSVPNLEALKLRGTKLTTHGFEQLYAQAVWQTLGKAGNEAFTAMSEVDHGLLASTAATADYPKNPISQILSEMARLIKSGVGTRLAFMDAGGWDTHARQAPQLQNRLTDLSGALAAFARDLGPHLDRTVVLVMSEFGRTMAENGTGGTDHGHGNVMWALGGKTRGGKVYGRWPGLDADRLYQGRDLDVTTDFRDVAGLAWNAHFGKGRDQLFPGFQPSSTLGLFA